MAALTKVAVSDGAGPGTWRRAGLVEKLVAFAQPSYLREEIPMSKLAMPLATLAVILAAGGAMAGGGGASTGSTAGRGGAMKVAPSVCDEKFRQIDEKLATALMKSEDAHVARSAAYGAYQRCLAGDADAFDRM
jgi:hypothetical protein